MLRQAVMALLVAGLTLSWATAEEKDKDKPKTLDTEAFVKQAGYINYGEIGAGTLAMQRSSRPEVKRFGARLVQDHSKSNQEMLQLAAKNKWVLAGSPDAKHMALAEKLAACRAPTSIASSSAT